MKLKDLQKLVNESIEEGHAECMMCIIDSNYKPKDGKMICGTPVLELANFYYGIDWDNGKIFLNFENKGTKSIGA